MRSKLILGASLFLLLYFFLWQLTFSVPHTTLGLTYSDIYARDELGLDSHETFEAILNDLKPSALRLIAYWNQTEAKQDVFDFQELDFQLREAERRNIPVTLVVGYRTPRWPECHIPSWVPPKTDPAFTASLFSYLKTVVLRYKDRGVITAWQVENEPLLDVFGNCPPSDRELLKQEIELVKFLDSRPVMVTASGELSLWTDAAGLSEIFGTTLYRYVWNKYVGNFTHIFPPVFYTLRAAILERWFHVEKVVIAELQAEPWAIGERPLPDVPFDEQVSYFGPAELKHIVDFAEKTGISDIYLWGPEWWYWRKVHGDPSFWETGKEIFQSVEK